MKAREVRRINAQSREISARIVAAKREALRAERDRTRQIAAEEWKRGLSQDLLSRPNLFLSFISGKELT